MRDAEKARRAPVPGHKLAHVTYGVRTNCECGWTSAMWLGKGARGQAYEEWRWHLEKCQQVTP